MRDRARTPSVTAPRPAILLAGAFLAVAALAGCSTGRGTFSFDSGLFLREIFQPDNLLLTGLALTVSISVISQVVGVVLGVFAALGRMSRRRSLRSIASFYIWIFRGTPLLVQIALFYFGLGAVHLWDWSDVTLFGWTLTGAVQAGIFALGVNEGAYMSEIVRAGIISIDPGQMEAAKSLGMPYGKAMRRIVLPQAARVIVPPLGNEFNNMLKTTSLLFVIGIKELYDVAVIKQGLDYKPFEHYLAIAAWFLLLTTIWGVIQAWVERRLAKGTPGAQATGGPSLRVRLFGGRSVTAEAIAAGAGNRELGR